VATIQINSKQDRQVNFPFDLHSPWSPSQSDCATQITALCRGKAVCLAFCLLHK